MEFNAAGCARPWISGLDVYEPGKMQEGYIKLASNENNYGPSPQVVETLKKESERVNVYPYRFRQTREKIAGYCGVKADNVLLGNGSDELIDMLLKTFNGPVLSFRPTFAEYRLVAGILDEEYDEINLNDDFSFPVDEFTSKAENAEILFLCSPNSPTGGVISEEDVRKVLELGKLTVVDEAYVEFYGKSVIPLLKEFPNLVVMRTFAKAFALAGLRLGYLVASQEIVELLSKVRLPFNVNSLALGAGIAAVDSVDYMKETVDRIKKDRDILFESLTGKFRAFRSEGNFVFADVSPMKAEELFDKLMEEKIIIRCFGKFDGFEGEYVRITVGTAEENRRLVEVLDGL
ncbi:MAG: histidinol-phosphate transaminase [Candidatus Altiarchaeales archaeon]|nr:histidinol-phosphate transaminase [Candidatus Altiarchaeota archaeon]MCG2781974.1 histidinol-phosphate transaminase [Candidatus Altiarchaeales archaeon]MBU4266392.1 histidinol-phosphate transaminase [Candidatus Altiarchaeota archaeon]MBU4341613.1 histidinol-phosphate transaminase [Candidatus Altiarchaeota archaeon]MBU4405962.1 histidinol-phosphate transaminase [Candidatus Altiarchaeota archaeon]